jgi:hypothetical protein
MLSLRYFPANAAWAFTFGESMVRLEDEDMFFAQRARAIHAADRKGLQVDRSGIVSVARGESEDERMENPMYPDFTDEELAALAIMNGYKAFARDKHFQEAGLGPFTRDNEIIRSLAAKRMVSIRGSAIVPDKERTLEVMKQHYAPAKYARHFSIWQFKDPAKVAEPARSGDVDEIITAEEVATLRVGSLLWSDGRSWVVVLGGIAPVSMLSNSPGEWQPEGESAHSIGESFTVIARGNSSLPTGRTAQRKVSDWWDKRQTTRRGNPARTSAPVAGVIQAVSMALLAGAILHAGPEGKVTAGNGRVEDWRAVSTGETIAQDQDPTDLATLLVAMVGADAASAAVEQWREKQRGSVQPSEDRQENPVSRLRCPACRIFLHELILHPGVNFCRVCGEDETKPAYYVMAGGELEAIYPDVSFVENQSCVDVEGERIYLGLRPPEGWAHALKRLDTPHGGAELYVDGSCGSRTGGYCGRSFNGAARAFVRVMDERHPAREDAPRGAYRTGPRRANPVDSTSLSEREFMGVGMYGVVLCDGKGRAFKVARYETPTSYASLEDEAEWLRDAAKVPAVAPHVARFRSWHPDEGVIHDLIRAEMIPNGWGAPEFKGDSYVLRESDGRPVLVDAGMAIRYGKNLLKYARAVEPKKGAQITLPDGRRATVLLEHDAPGERKVFVRGEDGQEEWLPLSALRRDNPVGGSVQWKKTPGSVAQIATKTSLFAVSEDKRFIVHVNRYGSPRDRGYGYSFSVTDYAVPDEARGTAYTSVDIPNISRGERALEWATAWAEKRVARRENPRKPAKLSPTGLVAVRAADFRDTGTYKVKSGTKVVRMFRDPENGWWYEDAAGHHSERCLGFTKEEALEKILEKYGALRLENPLSPPGGGRPGAMDYERACPRCGTKMSKFKASAHPKTKACAAICAAICAQQRATAQALPAAASAPLATAALANGAAYQRGIERALGPDFDRHVLSLIPEARQEAAVAPLAPPAPARGRRGNPVLTWHDDNENLPARFVRAPEGTLVSDVVNHGIKDRWGRSLGHFSKITPTTVWNGTRNVLAEPPEWVVTTHATRDGREYGSGHHARSAPFTSLDEAKRSAARRIDEAKKRYEHELKVGTASWVPKPGEPIRQSPAARSEEEAAARAARAEQRKAEKEAKLAAAAEKAAGAEAAVIARRAKLMTEATAKSLRLLGQLKDKTSLDETARAKAVKAISDVVEMLWKYHLTGMPSIEPEQLTPGIDAEVVRLGIGGRAVYHNGVESTIYGESWDYYVRRQKEIAEAKDLQARANQALPGTLQSGTPRR